MVLPDRQYRNRIDGSSRIAFRNRCFLRNHDHSLALPVPVTHSSIHASSDSHSTAEHITRSINTLSCSRYTQHMPLRIPRTLSWLLPQIITGSKNCQHMGKGEGKCRNKRVLSPLFQIVSMQSQWMRSWPLGWHASNRFYPHISTTNILHFLVLKGNRRMSWK